eukprot:Em0003g503a
MDDIMELDISSIGELSVKLFDDILATFLECHYACESNEQLVGILDRTALDFRNVCEIGVTSVEKASSDWCENYVLWCDSVGDEAEPALRDQIIQSSKEFSTAFGDIVKCCQNFISLFLGSSLIKMLEEEEQNRKTKLSRAERAKEEAEQSLANYLLIVQEDTPRHARGSSTGFLSVFFGGSTNRDDTKRAIDQETKRMRRVNMIRVQEHEDAKKKLDEASLLLRKVKVSGIFHFHGNECICLVAEQVLSDNVKRLMNKIIDYSRELANFFQTNYQFFAGVHSRSLPSKKTAEKKSESIKKLKDEWDLYYKEMVIATSKHHFTPSKSVPGSGLTPVKVLGARYTF